MANTKISALTAGAPAQSTDLLPIDRAGANYSLQVSDIVSEGIVGGGNSGGIQSPAVVASLVLTGQTAVDGSASARALYTVPAGGAGVYRITAGLTNRASAGGTWIVQADVTFPSGASLPAEILMAVQMDGTPAIATLPNPYTLYLHAADAITCGTATTSGANSGGTGKFDVCWVVERLA